MKDEGYNGRKWEHKLDRTNSMTRIGPNIGAIPKKSAKPIKITNESHPLVLGHVTQRTAKKWQNIQ